MSIYDNIDKLLREKGISRRQLAKMTGISYSTIASCFSRRPENFPTKYGKPIAEALGVDIEILYGRPIGLFGNTIGELFDNMGNADKREQIMLEVFGQLNATGQITLIERAKELCEIKRYTGPEPKDRKRVEWTVVRSDGSTETHITNED